MKTILLLIFIVFLLIVITSHNISANSVHKAKKKHEAKYVKAPTIKSMSDAFKYLTKYGYDPCESKSESNRDKRPPILCQSRIKPMLKQFQTMYRLPDTGKLDHKTLELMNTPRCGVKDKPFKSLAFTLANPWPKNSFKWKLVDANLPSFGAAKTREQLRESFNDWANHAPLNFQEVSQYDKADFDLAFVDRYHFDEAGAVIAYAALPPEGIVRFNSAQQWINKYDNSGIDFRIVATHEMGHALGLYHSSDSSAIMYAFYKLMQPKDILSTDDRNGIQALYGYRLPSTTVTSKSTRKTPTTTKKRTIQPGKASFGKTFDGVWVEAQDGKIPPDSVIGGREDNRRVYVVRFKPEEGDMVPGKLVETNKIAEIAYWSVRISSTYQVLTNPDPKRKLKWVTTSGCNIPKGAFLAGQEKGNKLYVARVLHTSGSILVGKYHVLNCAVYYPHEGREERVDKNFEVLCVS